MSGKTRSSRLSFLILGALALGACAHPPRPTEAREETGSDDLVGPSGLELSIATRIDEPAGELTLSLGPAGELPTFSCTARVPSEGRSVCENPVGWFRGPGRYELVAEHARSKAEVHRAVFHFEAKDAPVRLTLFGIAQPRYHLDLAVGSSAPRPAATGTLPKKAIASEIARHEEAVKGCYQGALQEDPSLTTRVVVYFVIGRDGQVELASAEGAAHHPALVLCMLSKLRALRFPEPQGGAVAVTYPFALVPPKR